MTAIISAFVATLVTVPLLGYIIVFIIGKAVLKNHRSAVHLAVDVTTFFLIISVHYLIVTIWGKSFLWLLLLVLLLVGMMYAVFYWKTKDEMDVMKIARGFWRASFLLFLSAYVVLLMYGMIYRIIN